MTSRTPPFPAYPAWSTSKFWGFVRSGLRSKWMRWPVRYEVMANAKRKKPPDVEGKHKFEYQCACCKEWWKQADVEVDHITPVGTLKCYDDLPQFVERLFVSSDKLRVVCKPCHKAITKEQRDASTL